MSRPAPTADRPGLLRWPLVLAAVLALAVLARWPALQLFPHLTDETGEVLYARAILVEGLRPLVHTDAYNGAFWAYLMAGWLRLLAGSDPVLAPRLLSLVLGLITVLATLLLAAALAPAGRRPTAALLGGALMATAFTPSLVNSRVAWSNSSTPLWCILSALLLLRAVRVQAAGREAALSWLGAGLLGGLALQSHPSALVFLMGLTLWFLAGGGRWRWLGSAGPWLALLAALVAYSPVLIHNLRDGLKTLEEARASSNWAAGGAGWTALPAAGLQLGRSLVGGFGLDGLAEPGMTWRLLAGFWAGAYLLAASWLALGRDAADRGGDPAAPAGGGSVSAARSGATPASDPASIAGRGLPLALVVAAALGLPLFNRNWAGFLEARYLGFLLPFLCAAMAAWLAGQAVAEGRSTVAGGGLRLRTALRTLLTALLIALPLVLGWLHQRRAMDQQRDNRRLFEMLSEARAAQARGAAIWVDQDLKPVRWPAGGHPRRAVEYLLTMAGLPFEELPPSTLNHRLSEAPAPAPLLFLAGGTAEDLGTWGRRLKALDTAPRPGEEPWGTWTTAAP